MTITEEKTDRAIKHVTVLGTGVLGAQIAYQSAYCGFDVTAYDISDELLAKARQQFEALAARYEREVDGAAGGPAREALTRIGYRSDLAEAVRETDLVIEAVPEILDLKRKIFAQLGQLAPARAIFATNSSSLLPSDMAESTARPDRFLAMHFANEIWVHNTAEIMGNPGTDPAVYQTVVEFARDIRMLPVELKKEQPGYVLNAIAIPWMGAALTLLVDGIADPETIDKVWCIDNDALIGPFHSLDRVGLSTAYEIFAASEDPRLRAGAEYLKENYIDKGNLGQPTGKGFFTYPEA
jgi:3-hydroxyacyl-CoA dehydrogenase